MQILRDADFAVAARFESDKRGRGEVALIQEAAAAVLACVNATVAHPAYVLLSVRYINKFYS